MPINKKVAACFRLNKKMSLQIRPCQALLQAHFLILPLRLIARRQAFAVFIPPLQVEYLQARFRLA